MFGTQDEAAILALRALYLHEQYKYKQFEPLLNNVLPYVIQHLPCKELARECLTNLEAPRPKLCQGFSRVDPESPLY